MSRIVLNYAKVLFSYSKENKLEEQVYQDMKSLGQAISVEYRHFVKNKLIHLKDAQGFLEKDLLPLFSLATQKIIRLICKNQRLEILPDLPKAYCDLYEEEQNIIQICVTSVIPLSKDQKNDVKTIIQKSYSNQKLIINNTIDKNLIGGFRIQIKNFLIKVDLQSRLNQFKKKLIA